MPSFFELPNLDYLGQKDPRLAETLKAVRDALNNVAQQTGSIPVGLPSKPPSPSALNVTAAGGIFDMAISDNNPANSGIAPDYFIEYSLTQSFAQPVVIHLGPARNHRANLGNQTLYFRAYSQIGRASPPSDPIYMGPQAQPTPIIGGGATSGPTPLGSTGSGTAPTNGTEGGSGYGKLAIRQPGRPGLL